MNDNSVQCPYCLGFDFDIAEYFQTELEGTTEYSCPSCGAESIVSRAVSFHYKIEKIRR